MAEAQKRRLLHERRRVVCMPGDAVTEFKSTLRIAMGERARPFPDLTANRTAG